MRTVFSLLAGLALTAMPVAARAQTNTAAPAAQNQASPAAAPNPIQAAATAYNQCVTQGVRGLAANVEPSAGAASVVAGCQTQRQQLEQAVDAAFAAGTDEQKAQARTRLQAQLAQVQPQIEAAIRRQQNPAPADGTQAPPSGTTPQPQPQPTPRH